MDLDFAKNGHVYVVGWELKNTKKLIIAETKPFVDATIHFKVFISKEEEAKAGKNNEKVR